MLVVDGILEELCNYDDDSLYRGFPKQDPHDGNKILGLSWRQIELLCKRYDFKAPTSSDDLDYREALKAEKEFLKIPGFDTNVFEMEARLMKGADYNKVIFFLY